MENFEQRVTQRHGLNSIISVTKTIFWHLVDIFVQECNNRTPQHQSFDGLLISLFFYFFIL